MGLIKSMHRKDKISVGRDLHSQVSVSGGFHKSPVASLPGVSSALYPKCHGKIDLYKSSTNAMHYAIFESSQ